jgi:hypothetical protein
MPSYQNHAGKKLSSRNILNALNGLRLGNFVAANLTGKKLSSRNISQTLNGLREKNFLAVTV